MWPDATAIQCAPLPEKANNAVTTLSRYKTPAILAMKRGDASVTRSIISLPPGDVPLNSGDAEYSDARKGRGHKRDRPKYRVRGTYGDRAPGVPPVFLPAGRTVPRRPTAPACRTAAALPALPALRAPPTPPARGSCRRPAT